MPSRRAFLVALAARTGCTDGSRPDRDSPDQPPPVTSRSSASGDGTRPRRESGADPTPSLILKRRERERDVWSRRDFTVGQTGSDGGTKLGVARGFDEDGFFVTTPEGTEALSVEHEHEHGAATPGPKIERRSPDELMTMGSTRRRRLAVVLLVVGLAAALAPMATARVTVEMTVDGATIHGGETITVTDDPTVGVDIEDDESTRSVTVRVDGEPRRSFEPNATNLSERFTLDLTDGDHAVSVVVDGDERLTATIRKDSTGPLMTYTSPFESAGQPRTGEVTIERANTTLGIEFDDSSGVREVRIERTYEWQSAGGSQRDLETARIENPGDNVSHPLLFGLGENELHVVAIDVHGQRRTHDITVRVFDSRQPVIDLERFERTGGSLHVAGTVGDDVKVDSLSYRIEDTAQKNFVVNPTSAEPTRSRTAVDFEFTAPIGDSTEGIVLEATDVAGNEREWTVPVGYRGHIEPRLTIAEAEANGRSVDITGTVTDGRVTQVVVESVGSDGTVVDSRTVYDGTATDRVEVQERLDAADGETTVVIRAVDADGRDHRESVTLATPGVTTPTEPPPTRTPTPATTTTTTATPTPATTTAASDGPEMTRGRGTLSAGVVAVGVLAGLLIAAARRRRR